MRLGRQKHPWPKITLPHDRGETTAADVLRVPEGTDRDAAISEWCRSVWEAFEHSRAQIISLLKEHQIA
jgi:hypothetical protein